MLKRSTSHTGASVGDKGIFDVSGVPERMICHFWPRVKTACAEDVPARRHDVNSQDSIAVSGKRPIVNTVQSYTPTNLRVKQKSQQEPCGEPSWRKVADPINKKKELFRDGELSWYTYSIRRRVHCGQINRLQSDEFCSTCWCSSQISMIIACG